MQSIDAATLIRLLDTPSLIDALAEAFRGATVAPLRHHHTMARSGEPDAVLLLMPAWTDLNRPEAGDGDGVIGIKLVTVVPGNAARAVPSVQGAYLLLAGASGTPLAVMDGTTLTLLRTAAASALAARYLARADAGRLLMIGAGSMAPWLIAAHACVRPIREVMIWNHVSAKAEALAARLQGQPYRVSAVTDLAAATASADVISAATMSQQPLVRGDLLRPGTHVDLVGAYTPAMRESDDAAILRASVFVDTREGALHEAGDLAQPLHDGVIGPNVVRADLADLTRGRHGGRSSEAEITLFKSVGSALEDLAAAHLAWVRLRQS